MSKKVTYYPILKQRGSMLILWDGPRLTKTEALAAIRERKRKHPAEKFFIYAEEGYYQEITKGKPATKVGD